MKQVFFLVTYLFIHLNFCNAQIGIYKSVYGYINGTTQNIKTNSNNDIFVSINGGPVDVDPTSYYYAVGSNTGGSGSIVKYDENQNLLWGASFTSTLGNGFSINSIYLEHTNYVYIVGTYEGVVDLDPSVGVSTYTSMGSTDICIIKLTQAGQFVWAKSIGGASGDTGSDVSVDNLGNISIGAMFSSTIDADPGVGISNIVSNGYSDILLVQLDASGNYNWAFNVGNANYDNINKVLTYGTDVYIFGTILNTVDFNPSPTATYTISNSGSYYGYMAKYTGAGSFVKVRPLNASEVNLYDATINKNDMLVIAGNYKGTIETNPAGPSYTLTANGYREGFIAKYDTALQVQFAISTRGNISNFYSDCYFYGVDTDSLQNIYVTGSYMEEIDFDPSPAANTFTTTGISGELDALVLKYSPTGQYIGGFKFGNANTQFSKTIALNKNLQFYISGTTTGVTDYDPAATTATLNTNCFLAKYGSLAGKTNTLNINICHGQNYMLNGKSYSATGLYKEVFYLINGNDSTVYLNLNVQNTNPYVTTDGSILKSNALAGATFQWLNCNGYQVVSGANSYSYSPADNDSYAVAITYAGCTDTSSCNNVFISVNAGVPQLNWVYKSGDWGSGRSLFTDNYNNVYVSGGFQGIMDIDFSASEKNIQSTSTSVDIFLSKYDNNGNYIWSVPMGTSGTSTYAEKGESVFVDEQQNVYVAGTYQFPFDIDPGSGVYMLNDPVAGCCDDNIFIAKFNANGQLIWAKGMGGNGYVYLYNLSMDKSGNIAIVGEFTGTFDVDPGTPVLNLTGGTNALSQGYLAKFNNNGTLLSAMSFTTNNSSVENLTRGVTFDGKGNMIVTGSFTGSMDFDPSVVNSVITSSSPATTDIFYAKYSPSMQLIWAKRIGAASTNDFGGFIVSGQNNDFYMSGKGGLAPVGADFVARFDSMGVLKTTYNLTSTDDSYYLPRLAIDKAYNLYVAGTYFTTVNVGSGNQSSVGVDDIYLVKYASATPSPKWGFRLGSSNNETAAAVAVDKEGNVFVTGYFNNTIDFDPSPSGTYTLDAVSGGSNFIAKYGQGCAPINTISTVGTGFLTTSVTNSFYEWKDCNTNQIVGSTTTNTFYPVTPGQYKAIIHQGNCVDSSACQTVSVITTGIEVQEIAPIQIYPVPAFSSITVYSTSENITYARLYDVNGRLVFDSNALINLKELNITLENIKDGIYMLEITSDDKRISRKKIIKAGS